MDYFLPMQAMVLLIHRRLGIQIKEARDIYDKEYSEGLHHLILDSKLLANFFTSDNLKMSGSLNIANHCIAS